MASISELACIYPALIPHNGEVTVTEDKINAPTKAAGVNVEPFWPGLFAKALANVNIETLIYNTGLVALPQQEVLPLQRTKWEQRKKTLRSPKMT